MSRYRGNADACPHCGLTYGKLRTGLTYQTIHDMLKDYSPDSADWKYKRPGTILGKWHQIKKELWLRHIEVECDQLPANVLAMQEVPF